MRRRRTVVGALLLVVVGLVILLLLIPVSRMNNWPSAFDPLSLLNFAPDQAPNRAYTALGNVAALPLLDDLILYANRIGPDTATRQVYDFYGLDLPSLEWFVTAGTNAWDRLGAVGFSATPRRMRNALVVSDYYEAVEESEAFDGSFYQTRRDLPGFGSPFVAAWLGIRFPANVALLNSYMVTGSETTMRDTLTAYGAEAPSLADDPAYRAALTAITRYPESAGRDDRWLAVLGDHTVHSRFLGFSWNNLGATNAADAPLPNFTVATFAFRCAGETPYLTWALAFPPGKDASAAAEELAVRAQWFINVYASGRWTLSTVTGTEVENLPVAVVVAQNSGPACRNS